MKFGVFLDYALEQGFESVATGHYARKRVLSDGHSAILRGADPNKDQSYFLALMTAFQADHALFPAGELLKPEVREVARRRMTCLPPARRTARASASSATSR